MLKEDYLFEKKYEIFFREILYNALLLIELITYCY